MTEASDFIFHLARLGLVGRPQDVQAYVQRIVRRIRVHDEALADRLAAMVRQGLSQQSPFRDAGGGFVPIDGDSRQHLVRHEHPVLIDQEPILPPPLRDAIEQIRAEIGRAEDLARAGLTPTRSLLFVGPPGVGKTLSARWLACSLKRPLLTLDLSSVMSSLLGKTGANLRQVLDYAKSIECVLLIDEFDALAKRRDDQAEVGELKRLVTVLLQEIDDWPSTGLLITATNHPELLDPAIWRRFDHVLHFPAPTQEALRASLEAFFGPNKPVSDTLLDALSILWSGCSFSEAQRRTDSIRRRAVLTGMSAGDIAIDTISADVVQRPLAERKHAAQALSAAGISDRKIQLITGVARDTLRNARREKPALLTLGE
ncbi:AAA family ATPase [Methylobacterium sp.]|uniref:AAA family ATPase n=1 Tax=Methylobacterium sp. TaxID=409 RepID=UPI003B006820